MLRLRLKKAKKAEAAYDAELVRKFKLGDESAFTEIFDRYYTVIRAVANDTLHNASDAEEVAQDTFIRAHRGLATFRGESSLVTWLYCIGTNLARNRYWYNFRRHKHNQVSLDFVVEGSRTTVAEFTKDPNQDVIAKIQLGQVVEVFGSSMAELPERHREILIMRCILELNYKEIALNLRIDIGTVKSRLARARNYLDEKIADRLDNCVRWRRRTRTG